MVSPAKSRVGRPTDYAADVADKICERIADGESLRTICRDDDMPSKTTIFRWLRLHPEFSYQYARAREAQADSLFDDILEIADDARNDWMERRGEDGSAWVLNGEHVQRSRLRIDARKWMAGKLRPKVYGDKQTVEHSGPDGKPIQTEDVTNDAEAFARRMASLAARASAGGVSGQPDTPGEGGS